MVINWLASILSIIGIFFNAKKNIFYVGRFGLFGTITRYPKSFQFWFDKKHKTGMAAIPTRFANASSATITGGVRITYPRNSEDMRSIHEIYGSAVAVEAELVNSVIQKSFFNIGPLMTAQESYKDKRPDIIRLAQDMANNGVFKVSTKDVDIIDPITGKKKIIQKMELVEQSSRLADLHDKKSLS